MQHSKPLLLAILATVASGCGASDGKVDIGTDKPGSVSLGLEAYSGSWDGYAEAYQFDSASDRIRITLDANGQGTVEFGDAPPLPAATDPNIGPIGAQTVDKSGLDLPIAGFRYPVYEPSVDAGRIRLSLNGPDVVKAWCQLGTPMPTGELPEKYSCAPSGWSESRAGCFDYDPATGQSTQYDCARAHVCSRACVCTTTTCDARHDTPIELDGALDPQGTEFVGTLALPQSSGDGTPSQRITVRMHRQ